VRKNVAVRVATVICRGILLFSVHRVLVRRSGRSQHLRSAAIKSLGNYSIVSQQIINADMAAKRMMSRRLRFAIGEQVRSHMQSNAKLKEFALDGYLKPPDDA